MNMTFAFPTVRNDVRATLSQWRASLKALRLFWGRHPRSVTGPALVLFPCLPNRLHCGLAGIVALKRADGSDRVDVDALQALLDGIQACVAPRGLGEELALARGCREAAPGVSQLLGALGFLRRTAPFYRIFRAPELQARLGALGQRMEALLEQESAYLSAHIGRLDAAEVNDIVAHIDALRDAAWCLEKEILANSAKVRDLLTHSEDGEKPDTVRIFRNINAVLNSIDHLEVRGRDSAGISLMFMLEEPAFADFTARLGRAESDNLLERVRERSEKSVLGNRGISIHTSADQQGSRLVAVSIAYKVAAEIGRLGDNIRFLRREIREDRVLQILAACPHRFHTVSSHTRWASVGAINEANCHPLDARTADSVSDKQGAIHVCLNGDIDNFQQLRQAFLAGGGHIPEEITTDTKIIPLQVEKYLGAGLGVLEAFRRAVNDFEGSHAISMHTALAPGKLFLAQRGSGQAIFIGLAPDHYMPTSEVYGFIEETQRYLKMDGEKVVEGPSGPTQGQIYVLDQEARGGLEGIQAIYYDGTPRPLSEADIKHTALTSRDINRQNYPHYFLKEISEAPRSVEKTLENRWKIQSAADGERRVLALGPGVIPPGLEEALRQGRIRRIFFVGQGTAGVAAQACANVTKHYLDDPVLQVTAMKASELSGFLLQEHDSRQALADALVVAISQSGTTTDTNRTVDMVRERGAHTLGIVNRRDSDLTFKVDGVMYTSSGRDIEMSVASTKAFYSQIVAGTLLGLYLAGLKGRRDAAFISREIEHLLALPDQMRRVIGLADAIQVSAARLAPAKTYWAAVGSGPNKAAADEIRIKLSELCYKTISSDFVEDKKHIDLSAEPLIIVCAAGTRSTVIGDIIKDTAIFRAHKAAPVVIADEGETRFAPYAEDVFHVPAIPEHLAPVLNTLVGHLWGYYAALAFNEASRTLFAFQEAIQNDLTKRTQDGMDVYEIVLEKSFRQKFAEFYREFRRLKVARRIPAAMGLEAASDLTLLLKYLAGRLPASDFELDFGLKGTARNLLDTFFHTMGTCINAMARPVDAIKHQAKTVTVGTSRISERVEGLLFEALGEHHLRVSQLTNRNVMVLKNLQEIVAEIMGAILYRIGGLDLLGEVSEQTTIEIVRKSGVLAPLTSRVESDKQLKGTKEIIVRQGNVYIGKGRKDDRSIIIIPAISDSPQKPNAIEYLLLLNIGFKPDVPVPVRVKALGGKYQNIRNIVQENSLPWDDRLLGDMPMDELFGRSAEKIAEGIVALQTAGTRGTVR
jgi:glucosamine--fructose-6-phosphate aminotransferase (isomerizing)